MNQRVEVKVPFENVNDPTARIISWSGASGSPVKEGVCIAVLENSKATFDVPAPASGNLEYTLAAGIEVAAGDTLCYIVTDKPATATTPAPAAVAPVSAAKPSSAPSPDALLPTFSQKASKLIKELALDPAIFAGMTMVQEADVRKKIGSGEKPKPAAPAPAPTAAPATPVAPARTKPPAEEGTEQPFERSKLFENRELGAANSSALRSTIYFLCPAAGFREACAAHKPPVNRLAVTLFETVSLLAKYRHLNACFLEQGVFLYQHVHIGFAVDIDRGLKVLVIRNAEQLKFPELAARVEDLLVKYSTNTLTPEDVTGSTFTVTDLSETGVFTFEPLLNNRQAAILAVGAEQPGLGFMLGCAFDHRLTSGRFTAEFLNELSGRLVAHANSLQNENFTQSPPFCSRCFATIDDLRQRQAFLVPTVEKGVNLCSICLQGH
jgi:pyruvate/2-oxoglutarate dehydrogenase complex dihydrolipoamide acyltransferase (E2) component